MSKKRTFKVGADIVDIPLEEVDMFLKEVPEAQEVQSFVIDKDTVDIPLSEVEAFKTEVPEAKPLFKDDAPIQVDTVAPGPVIPTPPPIRGRAVPPPPPDDTPINRSTKDAFVNGALNLPKNVKDNPVATQRYINRFAQIKGINPRILRQVYKDATDASKEMDEVKSVYDQNPDNTDALYRLAQLHTKLGQYDLAYQAYDALEGKLHAIGTKEYLDPNNPNKRPDYVQQRQLPAVSGMAYVEHLRGNEENAQRLKKITEQFGYKGFDLLSEGEGGYMQPQGDTPSTYGFSGKRGNDSIPTKESEYLNSIADAIGRAALSKPMVEMTTHGLEKTSKAFDVNASIADRSLNLLTGVIETAMGVAGMATGEGAIFGLPFMQVQNSVPAEVSEWMMPVSKVLQEYYKEQGKEAPEWATNTAVLTDFVVMAALGGVAHGTGKVLSKKAEARSAAKQIYEIVDSMPADEIATTLNHIEGKIHELGGIEGYVAERTKVLPEIAKRVEEIKQEIKVEQEVQSEVPPYKPEPAPSSLRTVKEGASVLMDGVEGTLDRGDDGTWYFNTDDGKSTQIKVQDKFNPTETLGELGIQVLQEPTPDQIARAMADAEMVGEVEYGGQQYFVSLDRVGNPEPNGDFVLRRMADGSLKDPFDSHPNKTFGQERKLAVINKMLEEKGLPKRKALTPAKAEKPTASAKKSAEGPVRPEVEPVVETPEPKTPEIKPETPLQDASPKQETVGVSSPETPGTTPEVAKGVAKTTVLETKPKASGKKPVEGKPIETTGEGELKILDKPAEQTIVGSNAAFEHAGQPKRGVITGITDTGYIIEDGSGRKYPVKKDKATIVEIKPIEKQQAEAKGNEFTEMYGTDYSPGGTVGTQVPVGGQPSYSAPKVANIVSNGGRVPVDPIRGLKPKKLRDIVFDVTSSLSSRLIYSMSGRRRALGSYSPSSGGMKVKFNNDLNTTAHELGHLLDDRHGILPEAEKSSNWTAIESELMQFSQYGSKPPSSLNAAQAKRYTLGEGVAEWVRAYLVNPKEAQRLAPEFTKLYEAFIPSEIKQKIFDFGTDIRTFAGASEHDMIMSNVRMQPDAKQNFISSLLKPKKIGGSEFTISPLDRLAVNFWNPLKITDKAFKIATELNGKKVKDIAYSDNPHILARLLLGAGEKFMDFVKTGLRDAQGELVIDPVTGEYVSLDYMLKALDSTTEGTLMAEMERAASYMIAERTVELANRFDRETGLSGIGGGVLTDLAVAKGRLKEHNNSNPVEKARIEEATRRYRLIGDAMLRYMVEKGRMHYDTYKLIKDNNLQYVAMKRIMETEPGGDYNFVFKSTSGKLGIKKEVVKAIQGSSKTIENPFSSLMDDIYKITRESDRNDFMRAFVEPLFSKRGMYDGTVKELADIGQVVPKGTPNSIVVYLDGNPVSFLFHPDIHKGLTAFDNVVNLPGVVTALPKLLRWTVTHFPVFAAKNWVRDVQQRIIVSGSGVKTLFGNKMDRHNLAAAGGLNSGHYFRDQSYYYDLMGEAIGRVSKQNNSIVINPKKFGRYWNNYTDLLQSAERANRIAEYRSAFKQAKKEGHNDYDASIYAAYRSRDLLDFAFQGEQMKWINQIIPFSNAAIQGLRKAALSAKENPKAFAARLALYSVVPAMAEWAWNHKDKETAKEYENLPNYKRDLFYNFKVGNVFVSIPKPYEISLIGAGVSRGLSKMDGNDKAFDGYSGTVAQSMFPFNESNILGPMQTMGEAITNKDLFRDQYIVPVYEENLDMRFRHTNRSSRVGQLTSKGLDAIDIEVDPRKIDFVIKDLFSYFGKTGLKLSDLGKGTGSNKFDITDVGFATLPPGPTSKAYMELQEYAKKYNLIQSKDYKDVSALITDYYNADGEGKDIISKKIIEESEALLEKFENQSVDIGNFYDLKSDAIKYELTKDKEYKKLVDKVADYKKKKSEDALKDVIEMTNAIRKKWSQEGYELSDSND